MKRSIFLVILGSFLAAAGFAQTDLQTVAIVNLIRSEPISVKQLRTEVERMEKGSGRTLNQEERKQVLDVIINERLAVQAAERDKITITENEVNQQVQQLRSTLAQQLGRQPTEAEFSQAVRNESGLDVTAFTAQLRRQMVVQKYLMAKKEPLIKSIKVPTEDEIRSQFNLVRAQFVRPETVRFTGIQVPYGSDAAARTRAKTLADSLVRDIGSNVNRFDAAVERGHAPNSGYQAGDGGYVPMSQEAQARLGKDFIDTAFKLRQGEVSKLIESTTGFMIIKITDNLAMKPLELDDLVPDYFLPAGVPRGSRVTVKDLIGNAMLTERQQAILAQASQELVTELRAGNRTFQVFENFLKW